MGKGNSERSRDVTVRSEGASVNTDATALPSYGQAFVAVRKPGRALAVFQDTAKASATRAIVRC